MLRTQGRRKSQTNEFHPSITRRLLAWFRRHQRDLPWRHCRDPYRIWLSEVMLQQTQVATVVPYFKRFVGRFPTLASMAAAREMDVLRLWEGLGYYRRARDLHRAARHLISQGYTQIPDDPAVVSAMPGVGRYIMGALLSQAFERRLPILEANSERVLCRILGVRGDPKDSRVRARLWKWAERLLPKCGVGDFNQSLMELGALVCTPAAPRCADCPVAAMCVAHERKVQHLIPRRSARPAPVTAKEVAIVIRKGQRVLLARRPEHGRWAGMWEFPRGPVQRGESLVKAAKRISADHTGMSVALSDRRLSVTHAVNHHRITLSCFGAMHVSGAFRSTFYTDGKWLSPAALTRYPMSVPQRRVARWVLDEFTQHRHSN